jgi:hypothetical protein
MIQKAYRHWSFQYFSLILHLFFLSEDRICNSLDNFILYSTNTISPNVDIFLFQISQSPFKIRSLMLPLL